MIVSLNGYVLNDPTNPNGLFLDEPIDGLGLPPVRTSSGNYSGRDGGYVGSQFYGMRLITLTGFFFSSSPAALETNRRNLAAAIATPSVTMNITTNGGNQYLLTCNIDSLDMPILRNINKAPFKITLIATDPIIYDNSSQPSLTTTNLVTNPSFESNTNGWGSYHSATISRSSSQVYVGSYSMQVVTTGGGVTTQGANINVVSLPPSTTYVYSTYVYMPNGVAFTVECDTAISGSFSRSFTSSFTGTGAWQRVSLSVSLTATENEIDCFIYTAASTTFYLDAVMLQTGNTATSYFDGSTANTAGVTYAWTGTVNNSPSTMTTSGSNSVTVTPARGGGITWPITWPITWAAGSAPTTVNNTGNATIYPTITLTDKMTNPTITNQTTGQFFTLTGLTTTAGDVLKIDMKNRTVLLNGGSVLPFVTSTSSWWPLLPGNNSINLTTNDGTDTTVATVSWRSGYRGI